MSYYISDDYIESGYYQSGISIDWGTKIITVPQFFLSYLGGSLYQLDTNAFRLALKDLEDSEEGVTYPDTHTHNTSVLLGGIQYARVIEILSPYTITFEETGVPYTVTLSGSNNNILEKTNLGTVQILSNNSAGLINVLEVQQNAFNGMVHIDASNSTGKAVDDVIYPAGTPNAPVKTLANAQFIAEQRGLKSIFIFGDYTFSSTDNLTEYHIYGEGATLNATRTKLTLTSGNTTTGAHFHNCRMTGVQGGETNYHECIIDGISNGHCHFDNCGFVVSSQSYSIQHSNTLGSTTHTTDLHNCYSGITEVIIDRNGSRLNQQWVSFTGKIKFINQNRATQSGTVFINMDGGTVTIDSSCTTGTFVISGNCTVINNSGGSVVDTSGVIATVTGGIDISAIWSYPVASMITPGSIGEFITKKLLTVAKFLGLK